MSVYLDPMVDYGKRIGRAGPLWCHVIADSEGELRAMARHLGLINYIHGDAPRHFNIGTERVRALAIAAGAIECDRRTFVGHMRRIRKFTSEQKES